MYKPPHTSSNFSSKYQKQEQEKLKRDGKKEKQLIFHETFQLQAKQKNRIYRYSYLAFSFSLGTRRKVQAQDSESRSEDPAAPVFSAFIQSAD